ncbi:MAG: ribosome maturation factor RimM [Chitinophagales bacterium]|jgi:16S rRNA processing protein RimM
MMEFGQIGYTRRSHGINGEIKVEIEEPFEEVFFESQRIYLEIKGKKIPYFVKSVRGAGEIILRLEDVNSREEAIEIQSKGIFLPINELPKDVDPEDNGQEYYYLKGYLLTDLAEGAIGLITEVLSMPHQEMAVVNHHNKEVLIPLNEELIINIDTTKRLIIMNLPEGLVQL